MMIECTTKWSIASVEIKQTDDYDGQVSTVIVPVETMRELVKLYDERKKPDVLLDPNNQSSR